MGLHLWNAHPMVDTVKSILYFTSFLFHNNLTFYHFTIIISILQIMILKLRLGNLPRITKLLMAESLDLNVVICLQSSFSQPLFTQPSIKIDYLRIALTSIPRARTRHRLHDCFLPSLRNHIALLPPNSIIAVTSMPRFKGREHRIHLLMGRVSKNFGFVFQNHHSDGKIQGAIQSGPMIQ